MNLEVVMKTKNKFDLAVLGLLALISTFPTKLFAPSTSSSIAIVSQVDLEELRNLRQEVKYLRDELRKEANAAKSAREEAMRYFNALTKLK